jgi:hypothetical protein
MPHPQWIHLSPRVRRLEPRRRRLILLVEIEPRQLRERGKKDSNSQSRPSSAMGDIMSTLNKLDTSFTRA